jgi:hypothetical protein
MEPSLQKLVRLRTKISPAGLGSRNNFSITLRDQPGPHSHFVAMESLYDNNEHNKHLMAFKRGRGAAKKVRE